MEAESTWHPSALDESPDLLSTYRRWNCTAIQNLKRNTSINQCRFYNKKIIK
jgi:hypothetical protein